jgi:hypothetical protein
MIGDDSAAPSERPEDRHGRPAKPPLTIDLTANPRAQSQSGAELPATTPSDEEAVESLTSKAGSAGAEGRPLTSDEATAKATAAGATPEAGPAAAAPPAAGSSEPPSQRPRRASGVIAAATFAGLIGAGLMAGILAFLTTGILPAPGQRAAEAAVAKADAVAASVAALATRVAAIESRGAATASSVDDLSKRSGTLEAASKTADERLGKAEAALAAKPEGRIANMDQVLDDLMGRIAKIEAAMGSAAAGTPSAGLSDLEARVAALETSTAGMAQRLAAVQARPPASTETEKAARALAIGTLRQASVEAAPFAGDLAMLQALGLDEKDIAALRPLAEKGAPTKAELTGSFPEVADRILAASAAADPNAGFFDRLAGFARGLVIVRPTKPIAGDSPDAVVSRMQGAVDRGDLAKALAERNALPDNAKAVSAAWVQGASDRLAVDRLVEKLSRAAGAAAPAQD